MLQAKDLQFTYLELPNIFSQYEVKGLSSKRMKFPRLLKTPFSVTEVEGK